MDYSALELGKIYEYEKYTFKVYRNKFKCSCGYNGSDIEVIEHKAGVDLI